MKLRHGLTAIAVAIVSLVLAPVALAHHPVGEASQVCDEATGVNTLSASFDNPGFTTTVQATDSIAGDLGTQTAPATFSTTAPGPDRAAGTVTFNWTAEHDSGTLVAPYEAVSGCEAPPPPTTTTTTPPPPPPGHHTGGPPHISTAPHGQSPRKGSRPPAAKGPPAGVQSGKLPFSGLPLVAMAGGGLGLLLGGTLLVGLLAQQRYNEARRRRRPNG